VELTSGAAALRCERVLDLAGGLCSRPGVALFICLLAAMAVCADYAIYLLLQCCDKLGGTRERDGLRFAL